MEILPESGKRQRVISSNSQSCTPTKVSHLTDEQAENLSLDYLSQITVSLVSCSFIFIDEIFCPWSLDLAMLQELLKKKKRILQTQQTQPDHK